MDAQPFCFMLLLNIIQKIMLIHCVSIKDLLPHKILVSFLPIYMEDSPS